MANQKLKKKNEKVKNDFIQKLKTITQNIMDYNEYALFLSSFTQSLKEMDALISQQYHIVEPNLGQLSIEELFKKHLLAYDEFGQALHILDKLNILFVTQPIKFAYPEYCEINENGKMTIKIDLDDEEVDSVKALENVHKFLKANLFMQNQVYSLSFESYDENSDEIEQTSLQVFPNVNNLMLFTMNNQNQEYINLDKLIHNKETQKLFEGQFIKMYLSEKPNVQQIVFIVNNKVFIAKSINIKTLMDFIEKLNEINDCEFPDLDLHEIVKLNLLSPNELEFLNDNSDLLIKVYQLFENEDNQFQQMELDDQFLSITNDIDDIDDYDDIEIEEPQIIH